MRTDCGIITPKIEIHDHHEHKIEDVKYHHLHHHVKELDNKWLKRRTISRTLFAMYLQFYGLKFDSNMFGYNSNSNNNSDDKNKSESEQEYEEYLKILGKESGNGKETIGNRKQYFSFII